MNDTKSKETKTKPKTKAAAQTITSPEGVEVYTDKIYVLVDEYLNTLESPEDMKDNPALFTDMLKYIYNNYIGYLLHNKNNPGRNTYNDIYLLDNLFNIYTSLVYKYKPNHKPFIIEYSIFTGVSREVINDWKSNYRRELTPEYALIVKNWYRECENALLNVAGVFEIFQLKSCYNYNDSLAPIPLEQQGRSTTVEALPVFEAPGIEENS